MKLILSAPQLEMMMKADPEFAVELRKATIHVFTKKLGDAMKEQIEQAAHAAIREKLFDGAYRPRKELLDHALDGITEAVKHRMTEEITALVKNMDAQEIITKVTDRILGNPAFEQAVTNGVGYVLRHDKGLADKARELIISHIVKGIIK